MSCQGLITILTRAMRQPAFRELLLCDPNQALAGYVLTPAESYRLRTLTPALFDQLTAEIQARLTPPDHAADGRASFN